VTFGLLCDSGGLGLRLRVACGRAAHMLAMGLLVASACALFGARSFDALVDGQGAWPWRWALLQKPALLCAFPLYLALATVLGEDASKGRATARPLPALELQRVASNVALCALGVVIFAGGWQSPFEPEGMDVRLIGAAFFVLKVWAFAGLVALVRKLDPTRRIGPLGIALCCAGTLALTALWLWLEPSALVELALGRALAVSLSLFALITVLRAWALATATRAAISASRSESA